MIVVAFFAGMFIGSIVGAFGLALCIAASHSRGEEVGK